MNGIPVYKEIDELHIITGSRLRSVFKEFNRFDMSIKKTIPNDTILTLTKDTLVFGTLAYYGESKEYGHDDLYFTAVEQH